MLKLSFSFFLFSFLWEWQKNMKDFKHESFSFIYVQTKSNTATCYDKSDQIVSLSFQQWCHADSRKTGQDKNDYIYICRIKCCTQYAFKKDHTYSGEMSQIWFLSETTENVASSTCCNSVLRDSRRGPDRRQCSDTSHCFTSATPFLNAGQSRTQCPLTQSCLTAQE